MVASSRVLWGTLLMLGLVGLCAGVARPLRQNMMDVLEVGVVVVVVVAWMLA